MNKQIQKGGNNSTNIQAEEINFTQGLTYNDVRQVAIDVFNANFYELAGEAKKIAAERAEEITEDFLRKLKQENPQGFSKANDPDFQYSLFAVQKEYAKTGDKDLGDLLVDLLVDRSKQEKRGILQIVLNESLNIAPKLTKEQLSVLAVTFLFRYTQNYTVGNHELFGKYLDNHVSPFSDSLLKNMSCYQHLQFSGCGAVSIGQLLLENIIGETYQGLFLKGLDEKEISAEGISIEEYKAFFIPCLNDNEKIQVNALSKEALNNNLLEDV